MENKVVRKSNYLVEASYKLSTLEQRVILFLASMIRNEDQEFKKYCLKISDFASLIGIKHRDEYSQIKKVTKKLLSRVFSIRKPGQTTQLSWLSSATYLEGKGIVELCFDPQLKPFLLQLQERFTSYRLKEVIQLKSSFSIRIYELLKQFEKIGERTFFLDSLKEILGIDKEQYRPYANFKMKVLQTAQLELQEKTDISFDFEEIKIGHGVGKIRFIIKSQKNVKAAEALSISETFQLMAPSKEENPELLKLMEIIPGVFRNKGSVKALIQTAFEKKGFDFVMRNIVYTNEKSNAVKPGANLEKGSNYRVYLSKALQQDYGFAYQEDLASKKEIEERHQKATNTEEKKKNEERAIIRIEQEERDKARIFMKSLTPETMKNYEAEAKKRLNQEALIRYERGDYIGIFEFKRKLEDVVMEQTGIRKPPLGNPQPEEARHRSAGTAENPE